MTPLFVGILIAMAAAASFYASGRPCGGGGRRGRCGLWLFVVSLLLTGLGAYGVWLLEKGPQKVFAHLPISIPHLAWILDALVVFGLGSLAGLIVRGALSLAKKR